MSDWKRVTLRLRAEDLENLPVALGVATGAVAHFAVDREVASRALRRLEALFLALSSADVVDAE